MDSLLPVLVAETKPEKKYFSFAEGCCAMTKVVLKIEACGFKRTHAGTGAFGSRKAPVGGRLCIALFLSLLVASAIRSAKEGYPAVAQDQQLEPCGLFSDLRTPPLLVPKSERTAIRIMPSRYLDLWEAKDGYDRTGVDLVGYDGKRFIPAGYSDNLGIYYYIPWISRKFHVSLARGISIFFASALILSVAAGGLGLWLALQSWPSRVVGLMVLGILTILAYHYGDVYLFEFAAPVALIPWIMRQAGRQTHNWRTSVLFAFVGLVIGLAATIRTSAAVPTLLVVAVLVATQFKVRNSRKIALAGLSLAFALVPFLFLHHLGDKRDSFLLSQTSIQPRDLESHTFWHFAYIGLGFVSNPYVPGGVCDDIGKLRVRAISPAAVYLSDQYDDILRDEVMSIVIQHPLLLFFNLSAKVGILMVIITAFGGLAIVAAFYHPVEKSIVATFWPALGVSALPILLVAPSSHYLIGVFTLAAMYGVFSFDKAFQPAPRLALEAIDLAHHKRRDVTEFPREQYEYLGPRVR
jgi:hypothetical protein